MIQSYPGERLLPIGDILNPWGGSVIHMASLPMNIHLIHPKNLVNQNHKVFKITLENLYSSLQDQA